MTSPRRRKGPHGYPLAIHGRYVGLGRDRPGYVCPRLRCLPGALMRMQAAHNMY